MNLFERVKQIIISPQNEWKRINEEKLPAQTLFFKYLLVLALIPAVATFIGLGVMDTSYNEIIHSKASISYGLKHGIINYASTILSAYIASWVIGFLAPSFGTERDFGRSFTLVAYAYTPLLIAGVVLIFPFLAIVQTIAGIYGLYILYLGLHPIMKTPKDKVPVYFFISILVLVLVSIAIAAILTAMFAFNPI